MKDLGKTSLGIDANIAGLLCYLGGFITGILFYVLEKQNRFVRFHAMQSIVAFGGLLVLQIAVGFLPFLGFILPLISLASFILWVLLMIKAYQGEMFKLPVLGDLAEKQIDSGSGGSGASGQNPGA